MEPYQFTKRFYLVAVVERFLREIHDFVFHRRSPIGSRERRGDWAPPVEYEVVNLAEKSFDHGQKVEAFRELARLHPIDCIRL